MSKILCADLFCGGGGTSTGMINAFRRAVSLVRQHNEKQQIFCYMLVQDVQEAEQRLHALVDLGVTPFAQPYRNFSANSAPTLEQRRFASYVNVKGGKLCRKISFKEYK